MSIDLQVLCRRPLPALDGGWDSHQWAAPKTYAAVAIRVMEISSWREQYSELLDEGVEFPPVYRAQICAVVKLNCRAVAYEHAEAYAEVIARATAGAVVCLDGNEVVIDHEDSETTMSGSEIEAAWKRFDDEWKVAQEAGKTAAQAQWEQQMHDDPSTAEENDFSDL